MKERVISSGRQHGAGTVRNGRRWAVAAIASMTVVALAPAAGAVAAGSSGPACFGKKPTIVASGSNKTVHGTKKSDVIDALGKNATVIGGAGNDLICVGSAKKVDAGDGNDKVSFVGGQILGGKGNDILKQVKAGTSTGKGKITGGDGNDTITLLGPGSTVDSGTGLDTLTVPAAAANATTITPRDGLLVNGVPTRPDQPTGAPVVSIAYDQEPGPIVFDEVTDPSELASNARSGGALEFTTVLPAPGRTLTHWTVTFGDGYAQAGSGGLPAKIAHPYVTTGPHLVSATQTDSAGASTTRTITIDTSKPAGVSLGSPTVVGNNITIATTVTPPVGANITTWWMSWGDGTASQGTGLPPATLMHTYPGPNTFEYQYELAVNDDHGNEGSPSSSIDNTAPGDPRTAGISVQTARRTYTAGHDHGGSTSMPPVDASTLMPGQLALFRPRLSGTVDSFSVDYGDGCKTTIQDTSVIGPCTSYFDFLYFYGSGLLLHSYLGTGNRTITVTSHASGMPDVSATKQITIAPADVLSTLAAPGVVPAGAVTMSTAGSLATPGSRWIFTPGDDSPESFGNGPPPASFTHVYPSGRWSPQLTIDDGNLTSYANPSLVTTSARARTTIVGRWIPAIQTADGAGNDAVRVGGTLVPSNGARATSGSIAFGDGAVLTAIPGFADGGFGGIDAPHGYPTTGDFMLRLSGTDSAHQPASSLATVSVSTRPTLTFPTTITLHVTGTAAVPVSFSTAGASAGTNAAFQAFEMFFSDSSVPEDTEAGYGLPATFAHTYPNPGAGHTSTHNADLTINNDHGGTTTRPITITIANP